MAKLQPSRRAMAARQNGRLGGLRTAQTQSAEFLEERAAKAGSSTRDTYGIEYYRYLRSLNPSKLRIKATEKLELVNKEILPTAISTTSPKELMKAAASKIEL